MALIKKPHELETSKIIKMLIYGQPGLGKTTLGLSAPAPLLIDFDGGAHRVLPQHLSDTVQVHAWQDVIDLLTNEDLSPYKTLVLDTAGKMLDFMGAYIIAGDPKKGSRDGNLTLQGYGTRKGMFQNFVKQAALLGKNLVFVAHDKEEKDGDFKVVRPEIGGSSSGDLIKELDLVGYMEAQGKLRTISFDPCEKFYGKNTCGLDALIKIPDVTKAKNDMITTWFEKSEKALETRGAMMEDYLKIMDKVNANLALVIGAQEANEYVVWAQNFEHLWDSKLQASHLLKKRATELGLKWNMKASQYEMPVAEVAVEA